MTLTGKATLWKPYKPAHRTFDLKFLLAGNSGSGKTHLAGSYTKGPVHFKMLDKGGAKTLDKFILNQKATNISVEDLSASSISFSDVWKTLEEDDKAGRLQALADANGMLVFDSLTALNAKALKEVGTKNRVRPDDIGKALDMKKAMSIPYWGQLLSWMQTFIATIQELPCAVAVTVHLHVLMNSDQEIVARYPSVNGQFRQLVAVDFDEAYLIESRGKDRITWFSENNKFEAKSRSFNLRSAKNITMDDIAEAYINHKLEVK